ncbi:hypothetical protein [Vibrio metschnikovii]|uniref:hypothetical protein n=1 Tax=Vibrio metschnikovii TaxID=28172 RepID=UPI001C303D91|nr:hypothetical protein [Vibrio metschnikovii]
MIILTKQEFHCLVGIVKKCLKEQGVSIKTTRLQDAISHSSEYNTTNGLLHSLPAFLSFKIKNRDKFLSILHEEHDIVFDDPERLFGKIDYYLYLNFPKRMLANSEFSVDYSGLQSINENALSIAGEGLLEKGIPFLTIMAERSVVWPNVVTQIDRLEISTNDIIQNIRLPDQLSLKQIDDFLNHEKTVRNLTQIKNGLSIHSEPGKLRVGKLSVAAQEALQSIENDIKSLLGRPEKVILAL